MDVLRIALIVGGVVAVVVGALRLRGPRATIRQLDETEANLARYASWRGRDTGVEAEGPTGADVMRDLMRRRVMLWSAVIGAGIAAVLTGLLVD